MMAWKPSRTVLNAQQAFKYNDISGKKLRDIERGHPLQIEGLRRMQAFKQSIYKEIERRKEMFLLNENLKYFRGLGKNGEEMEVQNG